jgi:hypothetical protein
MSADVKRVIALGVVAACMGLPAFFIPGAYLVSLFIQAIALLYVGAQIGLGSESVGSVYARAAIAGVAASVAIAAFVLIPIYSFRNGMFDRVNTALVVGLLSLPVSVLAACGGALVGSRVYLPHRRRALNRCVRCGYSRGGLQASAACPECGAPSPD